MEIDWETTGRHWKAGRLLATLREQGVSLNEAAHWSTDQWATAADRAGVNAPTHATIIEVLSNLAGSRGPARFAGKTAPPRARRPAVRR